MLKTKTKIFLASLAYTGVACGRALIGKGDFVITRRNKLMWALDLSEGIDFAIYLLGAFERSTADTLRRLVRPGDVVFDIGANIGAHTLGLARSVGSGGRTYAFEPTDFAFAKLKRNFGLNPELESRTHLLQTLLTADGSAQDFPGIYASWPLRSQDDLHPKHRGRLVTLRNSRIDTLDAFVAAHGIDRLDLIKIDVDGQELPVLQGGIQTLKRFRPTLVMEMSPYVHEEQNHSFKELVNLLREAGYAIRDATTWKALPLDADKLNSMISDGASINVIAEASAV